MNRIEYIVSERFIWDDLIRRGEAAVRKVREHWRSTKTIPRMLLAWPAEHIKIEGATITDVVSLAVPDEFTMTAAAAKLAVATKAYALLLVERHNDHVKVILESHHGARSWTMKLRRHGDVDVLEKEEAATDADSIGILWRPHRASS